VSATVPEAFYRVAGFHVCGPRAVRIDMLERLADLIRPMLSWRPDPARPAASPKGATGDGGFRATPEMMSILGCSADELGNVLKALGFWAERRLVVAPVTLPAPDSVEPAAAPSSDGAEPSVTTAVAGDAGPAEAASSAPSNAEAPEAAPVAAAPTSPSETPSEPEPALAGPEAAASTEAQVPAPDATPVEPKFEEVWRPRRRGRAFEGAESERRPHRMRRKDKAPAAQSGYVARPPSEGQSQAPQGTAEEPKHPAPKDRVRDKPRGWVAGQHKGAGRDRDKAQGERSAQRPGQNAGKGGFKRREGGKPREDRPRFHAQASPSTAKGGTDPDSPFAALSSLKAALEKRSQE